MDRATLSICVTCMHGGPAVAGQARDGARLFDRLAPLLADAPVDVVPVNCHSACDRGVSASIAQAGKWSYLLGGLRPEAARDLADYARTYAASAAGSVLRSRRPASLGDAVIGRVPALPPTPEATE